MAASEDAAPPRPATLTEAERAAATDALVGDWRRRGRSGDCIDEYEWHSFSEDGRYAYRLIDENACTESTLVDKRVGTFEVTDERQLILVSAATEEGTAPSAPGSTVEQLNYVLVYNGESEELVRDVYFAQDDRTWQLHKSLRLEDGAELMHETDVEVTYAFDAPVPATGEGSCQLTVSASLYEYDRENDIDRSYSAELFSVPCVFDNINSLRRVRYSALSSDGSMDDRGVWQSYLEEIGYAEAHPAWVQLLLDGHDFPVLYRQASQTHYFTNAPLGTWTRSFVGPSVD
jgi:hypothetical protein